MMSRKIRQIFGSTTKYDAEVYLAPNFQSKKFEVLAKINLND